MVVITNNPLYSVLYLVSSFLSASFIVFLLENEFLALFLLIIYLGAIAILFLFVVMMLDIKYRDLQYKKFYFPMGSLIGIIFFIEVYGALSKTIFKHTQKINIKSHNCYLNWYDILDSFTDIQVLGQTFYSHYVFQILVSGLILYIALIGVSFLTIKSSFNKSKREQFIFRQLSRKNVL